MSGHRKKLAKRGKLTNWRRQREGLVRTRKEIDGARHTHLLETAEGGTCQNTDTERERASEAHSHPKDSRWRTCQDTKRTDRAKHCHQLETVEGGTCQDTEINRPREAHSHSGGGRGRGWTCQDMERNRPSEAHPPTRYNKGRDLSGRGHRKRVSERARRTHILKTAEGRLVRTRKEPTERNTLTIWRRQRERLVRIQK